MGDNTKAEALRIAERILIQKGWKFNAIDVGKTARVILMAMGEDTE